MTHGRWSALVTAEHGGHRVPTEYAQLFRGHEALLASHRGWDPGTAELAEAVALRLGAVSFVAQVTRLLVDLNRSESNPRVFSEITRALPAPRRRALLERHHRPHRAKVTEHVEACIARGEHLLHLGVHSFTPLLDGTLRRADLAVLYDPSYRAERRFADAWCRRLRARLPGTWIRRNYPYRGASDGLATALRGSFGPERYLGIEIEVNQRLVGADGRFPSWVEEALVRTLPRGRQQ